MIPLRIFISSAQKEFAEERAALRDYLRGDALLRRFFEPFLFEETPAADRRSDAVYLEEVSACDLYVGLFGYDYGYEDAAGVSPTEHEFNRATELGKPRLIYVKGADDKAKHPKMQALIRRAAPQLIRRRFSTSDELRSALYASLIEHLERTGAIQSLPFDEQPCLDATLDDLDADAVRRFIREAHHKRGFSLSEHTPVGDVLAHFNMLRDGRPTRAAILLFGKDPQRFISCSEVRCMHFHGTVIQRPAPYYRIFKGNLFGQVDQAVDFVLSKLDLSVGTRSASTQAPTRYELPPDVIREAIVNAVAHRDYAHQGAIQVSVFADRLEVWNPGELLAPLTLEQLRKPHRSLTRNARVCEALYLAGYIEKYGTGTLMMIQESVEHALPEPDFGQQPGEFVTTLWRDWLTAYVLAGLNLNDRQHTVISHLKISRQITNAEYRQLTGATDRTAARDLEDLVSKGLLMKTAKTGRSTAYRLVQKPAINPTNPPSGNPT
jgi:predicted HTH transcriptional regulator